MTKNLAERFWAKVSKNGTDECWLWLCRGNSHRYGRIRVRANGPKICAHRLSWELHYDQIPDGMSVLHRCDVPLCVNPDHLFLGTQVENVADMDQKGRRASTKGESHGMAKLTDSDVRNIRKIYSEGGIKQKELARYFQVSQRTISLVTRREHWSHIDG